MEFIYIKATIEDIDVLVQDRLCFIDMPKEHAEYSEVRENLFEYYKQAFAEDGIDIIWVKYNEKVIGTGAVYYYNAMPSTFNISGKTAYITSVFVEKSHRRKGVATEILMRLVDICKARKVGDIALSASEEGRPLYQKFGFVSSTTNMYYKL